MKLALVIRLPEAEDVILHDLAEGELQASIDEVLAGLKHRTSAIAAAHSPEANNDTENI